MSVYQQAIFFPIFNYIFLDLFGTHHVHRITHESLIMTYFQCGPLMTCGGLEWEVESTTVTHSSADWWIFYFPWHRHQIEGTDGFYCLIRKTLASGVNGIAKVPKRKVFTEVGLEPSNVRSPVDALTHSATATPLQHYFFIHVYRCPTNVKCEIIYN